MNESKPFPAPYRVTKAGATIFDADNHPIAGIYAGAGRIATARLFAKSPELLAELRGLCFDARQLLALQNGQYQQSCERLLTRIEKAEAILIEMQGESR